MKLFKSTLPWVLWFLSALFFAFQFILRLYPGLLQETISHKFHADATALGILSSVYYYGYAGLQIPVAMLLDKYGPKYIIPLSACVCSLGTLLFALTNTWSFLLVSRFCIGAASAAGFLGVSKVISLWFNPSVYPRMVGISFSIGLIGAVYGGRPLTQMIEAFGWQSVAFLLSISGGILAFFIFSCFNFSSSPTSRSEDSYPKKNDIKSLFKRNQFSLLFKILALALANLLMVGTLEGFADIWSIPYLMKTYHYTKADASFSVSFIYIGMIIGAPLLTLCAHSPRSYYTLTCLCGLFAALLLGTLLLFHGQLPYLLMCFLFFGAGILCCYQVLIFAIGSTLVPLSLMGITIAFLNSVNMLGGSFFHTVIGCLLDSFWDGAFHNGLPFYSDLHYGKALWVIPLASIAGAFFVFAIKPVQHKTS